MITMTDHRVNAARRSVFYGAVLLLGPSLVVGEIGSLHVRFIDLFVTCWMLPTTFLRFFITRRLGLQKGLVVLTIFFVVCSLGYYVSVNPSGLLIGLFRQFEILLVVAWVAVNMTFDDESYFDAFGWYGTAFSLFIIVNLLTSSSVNAAMLSKNTGSGWLMSNTAASVLLFLLFPPLTSLFGKMTAFRRFLRFIQVGVIGAAFVSLYSLGAILSFFAGLTILIIAILTNRNAAMKLRFVVILPVLVAAVAIPMSEIIYSQIKSPKWQTSYVMDHTVIVRKNIYQMTLSKFLESPIIGTGLNSLQDNKDIFRKAEFYNSHNWILDYLAMTGIIGTSMILYALFLFIRPIWQSVKFNFPSGMAKSGLLLSLVAVLLHGMVEPNLTTNEFPIFFWFSLAVAAQSVQDGAKSA